jgi:hypothetical protein
VPLSKPVACMIEISHMKPCLNYCTIDEARSSLAFAAMMPPVLALSLNHQT